MAMIKLTGVFEFKAAQSAVWFNSDHIVRVNEFERDGKRLTSISTPDGYTNVEESAEAVVSLIEGPKGEACP